MKGKLNLFQASMLRWRAMHPYNAVHALRIEGDPDLDRVGDAIARTLSAWGVTGLELDARRGRFEYRGGPAQVRLRSVECGDEVPDRALEREIERELNEPFPPSGRIEPFRFFVVRGDGFFRLGIGYDHFVAAGDSIVMLMRSVDAAYREGRVDRDAPPDLYPPRSGGLLLRNVSSLVAGLRGVRDIAESCRRSVRPRYPHGSHGRLGFRYACLDAEETSRTKAAARSFGVPLNDLLMAVALFAVAPFAGARAQSARRHEIGAASIMNLRREFGAAPDAFGQFLSSFRVSHPMPEGASLAAVVADIHAQTKRVKRGKLYLHTLAAMGAVGAIWPLLGERRRAVLHAKAYATLVGVSGFDVNALWGRPGDRPVPEYIRAVPTGPLTPVVVAATSAGPRMHLGFSFRTAAFAADDLARISGLFVERCRQLPA